MQKHAASAASVLLQKVRIKQKSALFSADFGGGRWIRTTEVIDSRFTVCPLWPLGNSPILNCAVKRGGAGGRIRTPDLLITNQLLYLLSYTSMESTMTLDGVSQARLY